jgi:HAD superfamily hydrolase (TIGR01509 family)
VETPDSTPLPPSPRRPYRALLWDNDGVLVDTEHWYYQANREVLAGVGIDLTEDLYLKNFLASSGGAWHLAAARGVTDAGIAALRRERDARYERFLEQHPLAIPGVREALQALRPHFTMGIVTSSRRSHFEMIHRRTGFLGFFDFALTLEDYERSKPDPAPYLKAIARSGFPAAACLAIEDAPRGLAAARAAGLDCWVIPTELSRRADFSGASRILGSIAEVAPALMALAG